MKNQTIGKPSTRWYSVPVREKDGRVLDVEVQAISGAAAGHVAYNAAKKVEGFKPFQVGASRTIKEPTTTIKETTNG